MSAFSAAAAAAALSVDGTSNGYAGVASSVGFYVGQRVWLSSSTQASQECLITDFQSGPTIGLRFTSVKGYGRSNISAYLVADSARLDAEAQIIPGKRPDPLDALSFDGTTLTVLTAIDFLAPIEGLIATAPLVLTGDTLSISAATGSSSGIVSTGTQSLAGAKTFTGGLLSDTLGAATATSIAITGAQANGGSAVGLALGSGVAFTTAGARLLTVTNAGTVEGYFDNNAFWNGGVAAAGYLSVAALSTPVNSTHTTATTGGSLTTGTYYYRVAATVGGYTTLASTETSIVVPAGTSTNTVTVKWAKVIGASGYKVYGRSTGAELLMATLTEGHTTQWVDTGAVTPSGALPSADTTGVALASSSATNGPGIGGGGTGPTLLGSRHIAGYGALWLGVATPSASNYAISAGATGDTTLNAVSGQQLSFGLSNSIVGYFDTTGLTITGALVSGAITSSGSVFTTADTIRTGGTSGTLYFSSTASTAGVITSGISAANATATVPAIKLYPQNALDATDAVFGVQTVGGAANLFLVNYSGACTASSLTLTSSATTGLTFNAGGNVNWNLVRNSTSLELNVNGDAYQKWDYNSGQSTLKYGLNVGLGGSSTNFVQVFGACDLQSATVGNIGTGEDTLMTYQLPAAALVVSNRALVWEAAGTVANNANAKTITLYYGTATLMAVTIPISTPGDWIARTTIIRTSGNAQKYWTRLEIINSTTHLVSGVFVTQGTTSQTDAGAHNIYITATATADNDVTQTVNTMVML